MSCNDSTEIITALNALTQAVLDMAINVNPTITVNAGGCGCGSGSGSGGGGTTTINVTCAPIGAAPGTPGGGGPTDGPGPGESTPPGLPAAVSERQCRMAIWLIDDYLGGVASRGDAFHIDDLINTVLASGGALLGEAYIGPILGGLFGAVASEVGPVPGPSPDDIIWIALGIALGELAVNMVGQLDFDEMKNFGLAHRDQLVCALASSTNPLTAKANFMAIVGGFEAPTLSQANRLFVDKMFSAPVVSLLFYVNENYGILETFITGIEDNCPCGDADPALGEQDATYMCKAANVVLDTLDADMQALGTLSGYTWASFSTFLELISGGGLRDLFQTALTGMPTAVVQFALSSSSTVFSLLGDLIWIGWGFLDAFALIREFFQMNRAAILCGLIEAEDVAAAKAVLDNAALAAVASAIDQQPDFSPGEAKYLSTLAGLYPVALLNILFPPEQDAEIAAYEGDPCDCGGGPTDTICFEFETDLEGWTLVDDLAGQTTLAWDAGALSEHFAYAGTPGSPRIESPAMSHVVLAGDELVLCMRGGHDLYHLTAGVIIGGADVELLNGNGPSTTNLESADLTAYIGQTIQGIYFGLGNAGSSTWLLERIGINCACP